MKRLFILAFVMCIIAFGGISASAQCDRNTSSPIKCGYYDEGYQDGVADGTGNRNSDYRRYRNKFESQYESFYRSGYEAGFESVRPTTRWTNSQRSAYDSGYTIGQIDRRGGNQNRSAESDRGQYDQNIGLYFQQGYYDGFNNRPRQYDVPLGTDPNYPPNPGGGVGSGTASWSGRVDERANLVIRGSSMTVETLSGKSAQTTYQTVNGVLPRGRPSTLTARKNSGRGDFAVIQNPNRSNDYTAIVQIYDARNGADNYAIEISWAPAANTEEPYRSGRVKWRGRVDQTANIVISGSDVKTQDASGTGLSNVNYSLSGYLARRPGTVIARKTDGRGTVTVLQQPSWDNDFTAIVQVFDPNGGSDNYEVEITW